MATEKYIDINGTSIRTKISGSGEKAIVLVHGNSCSADFWDEQLNSDELQNQFQLIALNLSGHGKSDRSNSYRMKDMAQLIPALIEQLQLKQYILAGLSFGTCLVAEAAPFLKGCKGFFLASPNITNNEHTPTSYIITFPEAYALASPSVPDDVLTKFAEQLVFDTSSVLVNKYKESYLRTDPAFRAALGKAIMESDWTDEFANLLNTKLSTCFVFGKEEKILNTNYLDDYPHKWGNEIFKIERSAHFINNEQPHIFNKLLMKFADETFK